MTYDINDTYHLLGYVSRGIQNANGTDQYSWYAALGASSLWRERAGDPLRVAALRRELPVERDRHGGAVRTDLCDERAGCRWVGHERHVAQLEAVA